MAESPDDIVGHKTFRDGDGFRHEPLTRKEAEAIHASVEAAKARRAELFPDAEAAVRGLWDAWYRLKELGWKDPRYAPADGRVKTVIELGSTGLHPAHCDPRDGEEGKWWWIHSHDDLSPSTPIFYLPDEQEQADDRARGEKLREAVARRRAESPKSGGGER